MIPQVVERWVEIWHQFNYCRIAIRPYSFYSFKQENTTNPNHYILTNLLASNGWDKFSQAPPRASLNLAMTSRKGEFSISIDDVILQSQDDEYIAEAIEIFNCRSIEFHWNMNIRSIGVY
jgi:hypothetical protein